jgi:nitrile hydratase beta subunit
MNGVHDLGGMHGLGPVVREPNEPVFHHDWERRVFGIALSLMGARVANVDEFRRTIERMLPAHYLESSYYEHWLYAVESLLAEKGVLNAGLGTDSMAQREEAGLRANSNPDGGPGGAARLRHDPRFKPRFKQGDRVIARKLNPEGHTRIPRYVRGRCGVIHRDWGTFVFPDTHAHGLGTNPQHCYSVEFDAQELWGPEQPPNQQIYVDLWESYLDNDSARPRGSMQGQAAARSRKSR